MYVCVINNLGEKIFHKNMACTVDNLEVIMNTFGNDIVIGVECIFTWYWIADYCAERNIDFALGHALYMAAIYKGKTKSDKIDSEKIANMLRGGLFPLAYAYPKQNRAVRDLLRRRLYYVRQKAELSVHLQNTNHQYNINEPLASSKIAAKKYRDTIIERFSNPAVVDMVDADLYLYDQYHITISRIERQINELAKLQLPQELKVLQTIPGFGFVIPLTILYEIGDISRFKNVGHFLSYARLVKCTHESADKKVSGGHNKIGNVHLKWAFSEAAVLILSGNAEAQKWHERLVSRYGKAKAMSIMAQKLGRTVFYMIKHKEPFNGIKFYTGQ